MPFPGGIARSGSKVGSRYSALPASTNDALCPTLRGQVEHTDVPPDVEAVFEIVIDGLALEPVREAMRARARRRRRGGRQPRDRRQLRRQPRPAPHPSPRADAMTLTLTLREQPDVPLEADVLTPDRLAGASRTIAALPLWHGKERTRVGEFFAVSGAGDDVRLEGDLSRVKFVGAGMTAGRLTVAGDVGMHAGAGMRGGELHVEGDAGDWAGAGMRGGTLVVRGSAGRRLGGVYPGERAGMRGGEIVVHGDAGAQAGAGLRRGLIAVAGRVGDAAGLRMLAGTIVALGGLGPRAGAGMRRGSIVTMAPATPLATFVFSCIYRPPFLRLYLRRLRALGLAVSDEQLDGRYARWCGDGLELRRGEILILEEAHDAFAQRPRARARRPAGRRCRGGAGGGHHAVERHAGHRLRRAGRGRLRGGALLRRDLHGAAWGASRTRRWSSKVAGCPALTVTTDRPAVACLAAQYAGWRIDRDGYFAMGSGPGRALIRAEELYDDLDWDEHASAAVLCLETREPPPAEVADFVAERAGVPPSALTLLMAPTASVAGGVQIAARVVETALHKLHELDFDVRRVVAGFGSCPLPPVAGDDMAAIGRTNDAVLYGGQVHLTVEADDDDALRELVERLPASASSDYGEPFGKVLKAADFDFYAIDPLLFSPAQIRLTSVGSGRSFEAGRVNLEVLERSFWG